MTQPKAFNLATNDQQGSEVEGPLDVGKLGDQDLFLANTFYGAYAHRLLLFGFDQGRIRVMGRLAPSPGNKESLSLSSSGSLMNYLDNVNSVPPCQTCWIDPDGKGTGLLRIMPEWDGDFKYTFEHVSMSPPVAAQTDAAQGKQR